MQLEICLNNLRASNWNISDLASNLLFTDRVAGWISSPLKTFYGPSKYLIWKLHKYFIQIFTKLSQNKLGLSCAKLGLFELAFLSKRVRLSSNWKKLYLSSSLKKMHLLKYWGRLSFAKILRSSSICQNIKVVFNLSKYWGCLQFAKILSSSSIF